MNNSNRTALISILAAFAVISVIALLIILPSADEGPVTPTDTPSSEVSDQALKPSLSNLPVQCKGGGINCVEGWNGGTISLYSDSGSTRTIFMNGATGDLTTTASVAVGTWLRTQIQTAIAVTNTTTFTPTGTFQEINSTLNVTPTLSTEFAAGTQLLLENHGSYTITIPITPTSVVVAPLTLKAFYFNGTQWVKR